MATTMNHPYHIQHPIVLKREGGPFKCSGCMELGFGQRYHCYKRDCPFVLHDQCATARPTDRPRIHPIMGNRRFEFLWAPPGPRERYCDACGRDVRGFLYHDQSRHKFDLHPCCMNLTRAMSDPHGTMELSLRDKVDYSCVKCKRKDLDNVSSKKPFRGWSYVSSCGNYCYHVHCVMTLILENWETGYFNVSSSSSSLVARSETTNSLRRTMPNESSIQSANSPSSSLVTRSETTNSLRTMPNGSSIRSANSPSSSLVTRSETANSLRRMMLNGSSITAATSSLAMERRSSSRPGFSFTKMLTKMVKVGFSVIVSVIFGNPTPLFAALAENLVN